MLYESFTLLDDDIMVHQRDRYGILSVIADIGGVLEIIVLLSGALIVPWGHF